MVFFEVFHSCNQQFRPFWVRSVKWDSNKTRDIGVWDNTMILLASDNGPKPGSNSYGQTLPLRSYKSGILEGAIRNPTFVVGGYAERMLSDMSTPSTQCEYNSMVSNALKN